MNLYAESSAVLCWLLGEPDPDGAVRHLRGATLVSASRLTLLECRRALVRLHSTGAWTLAQANDALRDLEAAARDWTLFELDPLILDRAAGAFPLEPVRSLDALHLATILEAHRVLPDLQVLSLDQRVRDNSRMLGLPLLP